MHTSKAAAFNPLVQRCRWRYAAGMALWLLASPVHAQEPDWQDYAALLAAHVSAGERAGMALHLVDYGALAADPHFPAALAALSAFPLTQLAGREEQLAFYINAYNLLTIKMIVDHPGIASIKDIGNLLWPVWKRVAGKLGGESVSLDDIEHRRLRVLREARVHFAIVCASLSCPDLRREPYRAGQLDAQLDEQTRGFLENAGKGMRVTGTEVRVSKIFDWFEEDFEDTGGVAKFIARYRDIPADGEVKAEIDYDWRLNGQ